MRPRRLPQSNPVTKSLMRVFAIQPYVPEKAPIRGVGHVILDGEKRIKSPRGFVAPHVSPPISYRESFDGIRFYLPVTPIALTFPDAVTFEQCNVDGFLFHSNVLPTRGLPRRPPYRGPSKSRNPFVIGSVECSKFFEAGFAIRSAHRTPARFSVIEARGQIGSEPRFRAPLLSSGQADPAWALRPTLGNYCVRRCRSRLFTSLRPEPASLISGSCGSLPSPVSINPASAALTRDAAP